jgi:hypothetical protein
MAANINPIFPLTPNVAWSTVITTANNVYDGTGTVLTAYTAGANGSFVERIRFRALGTNVATVARVFINNGSTNTTAANNVLWDEISLPATTSSATTALPTFELPLGFMLPNGYKLNIVLGTTVSAGYNCTVIGGDY